MADHLARSAETYAAHGWPVYPQEPRGKRPLIAGGRGYLDATADLVTVRGWWRRYPDANIALAPGRAQLLVIDADGSDAIAAAAELGITPAMTLVCSRGEPARWHAYFHRPPDLAVIGNVKLVPSVPTLELRCDKGGMTLPPSVHPSGAVYRWHGRARDIVDLPPAALDALGAAVERLDESERARQAMAATPTTLATDALDRRIRIYLARVGSLKEGEGRNRAAYQIGAFLTRDLALDVATARSYLAGWNADNVPPLSVREMESALRSAVRTGRRPLGAGLESARMTRDRWDAAVERARLAASA